MLINHNSFDDLIGLGNPIIIGSLDSGYGDTISKNRNFSGWQKKYNKSKNDR